MKNKNDNENTKSDDKLEGVRAMFRGPLDRTPTGSTSSLAQTGLTVGMEKVVFDSTGSSAAGSSGNAKKQESSVRDNAESKMETETRTRIRNGLDELETREEQLRLDLDEYKTRINLQSTCQSAPQKQVETGENLEEGEISQSEEQFSAGLTSGGDRLNSTMTEELRTGASQEKLGITPMNDGNRASYPDLDDA